jgi:hypothetical protein
MAKTKGGNPVIGTVVCFSPGCDESATVHQIMSGSREGELYTRCPECKANQSTGKPFQKYLHEKAFFRPGFEHLQDAEAEPDEELEAEALEVEATDQDKITQAENSQVSNKRPGLALVASVVGVGLLGLVGFALGVKK